MIDETRHLLDDGELAQMSEDDAPLAIRKLNA
jgi:hypothetical protein